MAQNPLSIKQKFASYEELENAVQTYEESSGHRLSIVDSHKMKDKSKLLFSYKVYRCVKSGQVKSKGRGLRNKESQKLNCPFVLRVKLSKDKKENHDKNSEDILEYLEISKLHLIHNHRADHEIIDSICSTEQLFTSNLDVSERNISMNKDFDDSISLEDNAVSISKKKTLPKQDHHNIKRNEESISLVNEVEKSNDNILSQQGDNESTNDLQETIDINKGYKEKLQDSNEIKDLDQIMVKESITEVAEKSQGRPKGATKTAIGLPMSKKVLRLKHATIDSICSNEQLFTSNLDVSERNISMNKDFDDSISLEDNAVSISKKKTLPKQDHHNIKRNDELISLENEVEKSNDNILSQQGDNESTNDLQETIDINKGYKEKLQDSKTNQIKDLDQIMIKKSIAQVATKSRGRPKGATKTAIGLSMSKEVVPFINLSETGKFRRILQWLQFSNSIINLIISREYLIRYDDLKEKLKNLSDSFMSEDIRITDFTLFFESKALRYLKIAIIKSREAAIYTCKSCDSSIHEDENSIACDCCLIWFHTKCVGVKLNKKIQYKNWFCNLCIKN